MDRVIWGVAAMSREKMNMCASLLSPLFVAAIIVSGLASLSVENLSGTSIAHQVTQDHAVAIHKLWFRS
jgi:hypothetical protein